MLRVDTAVHNALLDHAREAAPEEACGILAGDADTQAVVTETFRTENVAPTPERTYEIDPEDQFAVLQEIEERGLDLVGFYHSHPHGPAGPSATDRAQATWPDHHYLIVSLGSPEPAVGAWLWTGDEFREEAVRIASGDER
ncbi:MAG: desampylase [Halodesulfurarchaeum sp.]